MDSPMKIQSFNLAVVLLLGLSHAKAEPQSPSTSDAQLNESLDRRAVLRAALQRNPAMSISEQKARAMRASAKAEGGLPAPEVMGQVWQEPLSHPTQPDAHMDKVGASPQLPARRGLSARARAIARHGH